MRKALFSILLMVGIFAAVSAQAAEELTVYPCLPWCCDITCVMLDTDCNCCCDSAEPLTVEFLGCKGDVLGTAVFAAGWCGWCGPYTASLDNMVKSQDVYSIRFIKGDADCDCFWLSLKVFCDNTCGCGKWKTAWKGDVWCWSPVAVEAVPAEAAPVAE